MSEQNAADPSEEPAEVSDLYGLNPEDIQEPPEDFRGRLKFLGPGLILVGSVVGSGEIILTTTLGSMVGFSMLWFVLLSCWSKNIIQAELGRFVVSSGEPFLHAFNRLPGKLPALKGKKVSWFIYVWFIWLIPDLMISGGIYGGAGQSLHQAFPSLGSEYWTIIIAVTASAIILSGTYRFIEKLMTLLVVSFTGLTLTCAVLLQMTPYAITWEEVLGGLTLSFPHFSVIAALAMYGGTGVGTGEQMAYTYWCVEKGYARYAGPSDKSDSWARRAKGWIKVMQTDVKVTMLLLTCATIPFYMLGSGVLYRLNLQPDGLETIPVLSNMYTETLGEWAFWLFLIGAFFVLFSTSVAGLGGNTRIFADGMSVMGAIERNDYRTRVRILRYYAVIAPLITATVYFQFQNPVWMLLVGHMFKTIKYPLIAGGTIYLRYRHLDARLKPSWQSDVILWVCFATMIALASFILYVKFIA